MNAAIEAIAAGRPVVVAGNTSGEDEGDLVFAAEAMTADGLAFLLGQTSGMVSVAVEETRAAAVGLRRAPISGGPPYVGSVDALGVANAISAEGRAATVRTLADESGAAGCLVRPGHVFVLSGSPRGVLDRPRRAEAAIELARLAGRSPAGALSELVSEDKCAMARGADLDRFAAAHRVPVVHIDQVVEHRLREQPLVRSVASARMPTRHGELTCHGWSSVLDDGEHIALSRGTLRTAEPVPVFVHRACAGGHVFGSRLCACREQLLRDLELVGRSALGVILYLGQTPWQTRRVPGACGLPESNSDLAVVRRDGAWRRAVTDQMLSDLGVAEPRFQISRPSSVVARPSQSRYAIAGTAA